MQSAFLWFALTEVEETEKYSLHSTNFKFHSV